MTLHPTTELVAAAWIASIPGAVFTPGMIATQPPAQENWPVQDGISRFVTVTVVGGGPQPDMPIHEPVVEIKAYATKVGSNKPPWFAAAQMLESIWVSTYSKQLGVYGRALVVAANGVQYASAICRGVTVHTTPRRIYNDPRNWACYMMDMSFCWNEVGLVVK